MAEPKEKANKIATVRAQVRHWSVKQERIGGLGGESYAVKTGAAVAWIDPLPLEAEALERLLAFGRPSAILLTIQTHQRASWRYAKLYDIPVYAPEGAEGLDQKPTHSYRAGAKLPLGLEAIALPGPAFSGHGFLWGKASERVLFAGDLFSVHQAALSFVPDEYMDAPDQARQSARTVMDLGVQLLCPGHGKPLEGDVSAAVRQLLARDAKKASSKAKR